MSKIILAKQAVLSSAPASGKGALQLDANGGLNVVQDTGVQDLAAIIKTGTWTPDLRFGAATTGITYTARGGAYSKIGDVVFVAGFIILSSKGSASGIAQMGGLPFTIRNTTNLHPQLKLQWISMTSSLLEMTGVCNPGQTVFDLNGLTAGSATLSVLAETAFANNSTLRVSGFYFT